MAETYIVDWNDAYSRGKDFRLAGYVEVDLILCDLRATQVEIKCLDVGCGTGQLSRELWHRGLRVIGVDQSDHAVEIANRLTSARRSRLQYMTFDFELGDLASIPTSSFELITCRLVFAFARDRAKFLGRVYSLLADGGIFVLITPLIESVHRSRRNAAIDRDELTAVLAEFFTFRSVEVDGLAYYFCRHLH